MGMRLGDTSRDYARWKSDVLVIRHLPEYKLRKLWKMNFSVADIAADKHYEVYPTMRRAKEKAARKEKEAPGMREKRGRGMSDAAIDLAYAEAVRDAAERLLYYNRLEPAQLRRVRDDFARFRQIANRLKGKPGGDISD
jgi:hypothetical protein